MVGMFEPPYVGCYEVCKARGRAQGFLLANRPTYLVIHAPTPGKNGQEESPKFQAPKLQRNSKPQAPRICLRAKHRAVPPVLVVWILDLLWCLDLGAWSFSSLRLDVLEQPHLGHFPVAAHGQIRQLAQKGDIVGNGDFLSRGRGHEGGWPSYSPIS